jgi:hypothetical protein
VQVVAAIVDGARVRTARASRRHRWRKFNTAAPQLGIERGGTFHRRYRSAWTHEPDLRPFKERF